MQGRLLTITGVVQGVGFRPAVWRLADQFALRGSVRNTGHGVEVRAWGDDERLNGFTAALSLQVPDIARIDAINSSPLTETAIPEGFAIIESEQGPARAIPPADMASCPECLAEVTDPFQRRYRYPFASCTRCGPRYSIVEAMPFDRSSTSQAPFELCADCAQEYGDSDDRRFHAQTLACHACGPHLWLQRADGQAMSHYHLTQLDDLDACGSLIARGEIVAIKGVGSFHLVCDATDSEAIARLRSRKQRPHKPLALMASDVDMVQQYCQLETAEIAALQHPATPIVLLRRLNSDLPDAIAPGQHTLGFMLPATPLHHLLMKRLRRPLVMTSGNVSHEAPCIDNDLAIERLGSIVDYLLLHDRRIVRRLDDSIVRVMAGQARVLRHARGFAPADRPSPTGLPTANNVLALGGDLKSSLCHVQQGRAVLSQHFGNLHQLSNWQDYSTAISELAGLYDFSAEVIAIDAHPEYSSSRYGRELAATAGLPLVEVQHHHAHMAAALADNDWPDQPQRVLCLALDGAGYGADGQIWGGEFLLGNYRECRRIAALKPVPLPGGEQAVISPWRNTLAQLSALPDWPELQQQYAGLELIQFLAEHPQRNSLDALMHSHLQQLQSSSCGRLFDAVAVALGLCREGISFEGQAAMALENLAMDCRYELTGDGYSLQIDSPGDDDMCWLNPAPMWRALLQDLATNTPASVIAARFHCGLATGLVSMANHLRQVYADERLDSVVLSGGVFQNRILFEAIHPLLDAHGYRVLSHRQAPCNDGGLSLGQAMVALASLNREADSPCV